MDLKSFKQWFEKPLESLLGSVDPDYIEDNEWNKAESNPPWVSYPCIDNSNINNDTEQWKEDYERKKTLSGLEERGFVRGALVARFTNEYYNMLDPEKWGIIIHQIRILPLDLTTWKPLKVKWFNSTPNSYDYCDEEELIIIHKGRKTYELQTIYKQAAGARCI